MRIGLAELVIIFFIGVLLFGVEKFQNLGKILGKNVNDFKSELKSMGVGDGFEQKIKDKIEQKIDEL